MMVEVVVFMNEECVYWSGSSRVFFAASGNSYVQRLGSFGSLICNVLITVDLPIGPFQDSDMLPKIMSEKKKLNLDRPILSVRKYSSIKLENTSIHPVKIGGSVPFLWEKSPGKARENEDNNNKRNSRNTQREERKSCDSNDKAFADALNTLSRIEYFLLLNNGCTEKNGLQNRELMVDGFLPHTTEKQSQRQLRLKMRVVWRDSSDVHGMGKWFKERNTNSNENKSMRQNNGSNRITFEQLLADTCDKANNTQSLNTNSNIHPPLLKSPADSWLGRTLSAKKRLPHSYVGWSNKSLKPDE
ncbi:hypothetical protein STAS_34189 [Striga asiatica]|uniref:Uncharacterized protein n=1 Tax=Striga asiatica TaxID=4170 RepID=A0A5A7RH36_STRAF|nr:hypothetical protein STAS_34189 [Striga asiatica]